MSKDSKIPDLRDVGIRRSEGGDSRREAGGGRGVKRFRTERRAEEACWRKTAEGEEHAQKVGMGVSDGLEGCEEMAVTVKGRREGRRR